MSRVTTFLIEATTYLLEFLTGVSLHRAGRWKKVKTSMGEAKMGTQRNHTLLSLYWLSCLWISSKREYR